MTPIVIDADKLSAEQQQQLEALAAKAKASLSDAASCLLAEILRLSPDELATLVKQNE